MTAAAIQGAEPRSSAMIRRAVISSVIGNGLEWYDFLVYGFFATIIAQVFFPTSDPLVSALLTAATFAISFLVRPVGGVLLSTYADRFGRKPILTVMILIMGFSTVLIGLTPGYATIGILAPPRLQPPRRDRFSARPMCRPTSHPCPSPTISR